MPNVQSTYPENPGMLIKFNADEARGTAKHLLKQLKYIKSKNPDRYSVLLDELAHIFKEDEQVFNDLIVCFDAIGD
jgi:hypothetical protein